MTQRLSALGGGGALRLRRAAISSSTEGMMRLTISATPLPFGCMPSSLVELGIEHDAVEEERIEDEPVLAGEIGEDGVEVVGVVVAPVGRRAHAGEQHGNVPLLRAWR